MENESPFKIGEYPNGVRECQTIPEFVDGVRSVAHLAALYDALMIKPVDVEHILLAGQALTVRDNSCLYNIRSIQSLRHMRDYVRASLVRVGLGEIGVGDLGTLLSCTDGSFRTELQDAQIKLDSTQAVEDIVDSYDPPLSEGIVEVTEPLKLHPTLVIDDGARFRTIGSKNSERTEFHILDSKYETRMVLLFDDTASAVVLHEALGSHIQFSEEQR